MDKLCNNITRSLLLIATQCRICRPLSATVHMVEMAAGVDVPVMGMSTQRHYIRLSRLCLQAHDTALQRLGLSSLYDLSKWKGTDQSPLDNCRESQPVRHPPMHWLRIVIMSLVMVIQCCMAVMDRSTVSLTDATLSVPKKSLWVAIILSSQLLGCCQNMLCNLGDHPLTTAAQDFGLSMTTRGL